MGRLLARVVVWSMLAAGCGGSPRTSRTAPVAAPAREPAPAPIPFADVGATERAKLSPLFERQWRAGSFDAGCNAPVIVRGRSMLGAGERAELERLDAEHVIAVTTTPNSDGTVDGLATRDASDAAIAHVPCARLIALAGLAWVARLEVAGSYPLGPELSADVERRLHPRLRTMLGQLRRERPIQISGIGKLSGCLDATKRETLAATSVTLQTVLPEASCLSTIFTFTIVTERLVELASIPWIVKLEGNGTMRDEHAE